MATMFAPQAPGTLGRPVEPAQFLRYLQLLGEWVRSRRTELDALDKTAQERGDDAVTGDLMLSMALWQSCLDRYELLVVTWDDGRVGLPEREKLASLVWGRMDSTASAVGPGAASGSALSLPEACRLSDALVGQLRRRLQLDPNSDQVTARVAAVRATIERLRDQVTLEPPSEQAGVAERVQGFAARAEQVAEKAARGGDVGGLLGPLELETSEYERDLIVGGARRRESRAAQESTRERLSDLQAQAEGLRSLAASTAAAVAEAPRYAVPDVAALGAVPTDDSGLQRFNAKLDQVSRALQVVQQANSTALAEREQLAADAAAVFAVIDAAPRADEDLVALRRLTEKLLHKQPTSVRVVQPLVAALGAATAPQEIR